MDTSGEPNDRQDDEDERARRMDEAAQRLDVCLGEAIRRLRLARRMSQTELASLTRISTKTAGQYERGQVSMKMPKLLEIATALDVELGDLVKRATDLEAEGFGA